MTPERHMFGPVKPDHLFTALAEQVKESGEAPTDDPIRLAVGSLLLGEHTAPEEVMYAFHIFHDFYKREVLEAFLITGADSLHVEGVLGIPATVCDVYQAIFFDPESFRDRLDLESYVRGYPTSHDDGFGADLKLRALELGMHWISKKFGREHYEVPASAGLIETIDQAYILSKEAYDAPLNSAEAKEARQWTQTYIGGIRVLPEVRDVESGAKDALKFELIMIRQKSGREEIPPEDIVVVTDDNDSDE